VPRADHRGDRFLALARVAGGCSERTDSPPLGEPQGSFDRLAFGMLARRRAIRFSHPGEA
jgi:hypothetical protein